MKQKKIVHLLKNSIGVMVALVLFVGEFLLNAVSLLASGTKASGTDEASGNAAQDGVLNYRTGQLDDGTDATGWYEKD
ncbi:MAG: hypothetical protein COA75_08505 [Cellvibrionales bacterium]|nr:MAG: hypothetical protein COA75_08505 [Cellvibrionales bacterium]